MIDEELAIGAHPVAVANDRGSITRPVAVLTQIENSLYGSRFLVLVAVASFPLIALATLYVATVDVVYLFAHLGTYADPLLGDTARRELRARDRDQHRQGG